ncbi:hypothetical protein KDA00_02590 [Candidatus Saccharibacteria bacterium]|nr:hypothetical protein [Candidatus Saccharibacteria bacterium]
MTYLDTEYLLTQTSEAEYRSTVRAVAISNKLNGIYKALGIALKQEDPALAKAIEASAANLHQTYNDGGGMYMLAAATGLKLLRAENPDVPPIGQFAWEKTMEREGELRTRPAITTVEMLSGLGLAEVRDVNTGYVDGYEEGFQRPGFMAVSGIIGLGALHAHDLMHFASQGQN